MSADRNLLCGLLALQLRLVSREQLDEAMAAWDVDKSKTLGEIFVANKTLDPDQHQRLETQVEKQIGKHGGDLQKSIQELRSVDPDATQPLPGTVDSGPDATLGHVSGVDSDPPANKVFDPALQRTSTRFRILRPHAKGGLGEVFVANDTELSREVALKEIQGHCADNLESRERFLREAEITGSLEHPGIVPVYGLGKYEDGRPFYAMRFIRGESLKEAIDAFHTKYKSKLNEGEALLELRQLLRRLVDVCNAMAYAHSRGVLHRDLKPGNIILGKYGETLVVDWGLAKAQGEAEVLPGSFSPVMSAQSSGATPTMEGSAMGTPAYMSPEQAAGRLDELSGATDVYSLGATLFHLLTGQLPIVGKSVFELVKKAEAGDVLRLRELRSDLPRALEAVCSKAMAKAPGERYRSPSGLAEDIEKWLADEPVSAYREPFSIRARRWVRRHPALVSTTAACVALGLCAALMVAYLQSSHARELASKNVQLTTAKEKAESAARAELLAKEDAQNKQLLAEQREQEAIDAVKRFGDAVANNKELKDSPKLALLRKELLKEPLGFFNSLSERLQADSHTRPESLSRLASAAAELGHLTSEIGDKQDALVAHRQALSIRERLARENPTVTRFASELALSHLNLGVLLNITGKSTEALAAFEQSKAIRERLMRENPKANEYANDLANCHNNIGAILFQSGKPSEALAAFEQAKAIRERLAKENPTVTEFALSLSSSHNNIGVHLSNSGKPSEALAAMEQARTIQEQLAREHPTVALFATDLARSHLNIGYHLLKLGKPAETLSAFEEALAIHERLVKENPTVTEFGSNLARSHLSIGNLLSETGRPTEALPAFERAKVIQAQLAKENPTDTDFARDLALSHFNIGTIFSGTGKPNEALAAFKEARSIQERLARENPTSSNFSDELAYTHHNIGSILGQTGKSADALAAFEQAKAIFERLAQEDPNVTHIQNMLGGTLNNIARLQLEGGQLAEARTSLVEAIQHQRIAFQGDPATLRKLLLHHYKNLQRVAVGLKDTDLLKGAQRGLLELAASDPAFAALDARLAKVLNGEAAKNAEELLEFADRSYALQRFGRAARFYGESLQLDPALVENREKQIAYNAACSAAHASSGTTVDDPPPDEFERTRLRGQAHKWLKGEIEQWNKIFASADAQQRTLIATTLKHWQVDKDLDSVRSEAALAQFSERDRAQWESLWKEVAELISNAEADK